MKDQEKELVNRMRFLRNAAPQQFVDFRAAFIAYLTVQLENLIVATDNLPQVQGHAQQCSKLMKLIDEVLKND